MDTLVGYLPRVRGQNHWEREGCIWNTENPIGPIQRVRWTFLPSCIGGLLFGSKKHLKTCCWCWYSSVEHLFIWFGCLCLHLWSSIFGNFKGLQQYLYFQKSAFCKKMSFHHRFCLLGFVFWVFFFLDCTMVNYHNTTIWENIPFGTFSKNILVGHSISCCFHFHKKKSQQNQLKLLLSSL